MRVLAQPLAASKRNSFAVIPSCRQPFLCLQHFRNSSSVKPPDFAHIDAKWQPRFKNHALWNTTSKGESKGKYYVLPMFPYPSGALHIGHLRNYTISDVIARYRRMKGYDVLHPIGWDAFGLPAENAAIQRGIDPATWTSHNIAKMKQQIDFMGGCWNWDRELRTCDASFYKETQKLFLALHKHGLAYQKEAVVNFDPIDQTVLANEQVDSNGLSWRSGAKVELLTLKQWFVKITDYAPQLLKDLNLLGEAGKWPQRVVAMQKTWLGRSDGADLRFAIKPLSNLASDLDHVDVFTTRPDTLFGVQYVALSIDHPLVVGLAAGDTGLKGFLDEASELEPNSKAGYRLQDIAASNPLANLLPNSYVSKSLPIFVAPYVRSDYGSGAVMGVPAHDQRDWDFWKQNGTDFDEARFVIEPAKSQDHDDGGNTLTGREAYTSLGYLNSICHQYAGLSSSVADQLLVSDLSAFNPFLASRTAKWRLRDWLISRQRYWGTPIPIVHCKNCGAVPVPESDLPVKLPSLPDHEWEGLKGNPLEQLTEWKDTGCPRCGGSAKRETDTMDTFVDSSWYYLKFAEGVAPDASKGSAMPVDLYVGGIEHAILHLLYARFISKFLAHTESKPALNEPFERLLTQGMVHGRTYSDPCTGRFLRPEELDWNNPERPMIKSNNTEPNVSFEKMSKSKYNGVDPIECMKTYGADTTRTHLLFQAPVSEILEWDESKIVGIQRWFGRVWNLCHRIEEWHVSVKQDVLVVAELIKQVDKDTIQMWKDTQSTVKSVDEAFSTTFALNTVVSDLMTLTNKIQQVAGKESAQTTNSQRLVQAAYRILLRLLVPIAPSFAEECWSVLTYNEQQANAFSIEHTASFAGFPEHDTSVEGLAASQHPCAVQFNGKLRFVTDVPVAPVGLSSDSLRDWLLPIILKSQQAVEYLGKSGIDVGDAKKIIVARGGRTINIVI